MLLFAIPVVAIEVGLVLEEVGIQLLVFHCGIGLDVVAEFAHLQIHALRLELGFHKVQDLGVWHGRRCDLEHHIGGLCAPGPGWPGRSRRLFSST